MSAAMLLEARGIHAWYGSSHVVDGVDLAIARGETVGLLGRNGMGKTTLIRALLGFVAGRSGSVAIAGEDLSRAAPHELARRGVAYVPEGRGIFPNLTVHENLVATARGSKWTLDRVFSVFPQLRERQRNYGNQLSGGEQQMLAIGRALMTQPDLVILDEATEGLAPRVVDEVWRVIAEIRAAGVATLIVDRDYRRVGENASRLVVLRKGRVALEGDAKSLLAGSGLAALLGV
ncbi:MAG TPA: ABC transporter ATP-binding protein [Usitatibacter sp.]|nr:ABC transporter ATP-binding protein [Usitatibacter sp.]